MKSATATPIKQKPQDGDVLQFSEQEPQRDAVPDLRGRVQDFYRRHPLRTLKRGERGIVGSLKADRDRR
jgi:hypothetical protein